MPSRSNGAPLFLLISLAVVVTTAQAPSKNIWESQYKSRTPAEMAAEFEEPSRPVFRYRAAIAGLLELSPGNTVADIGAGSGFLARYLASKVGPTGRVIATELDAGMVAYMNDRARREGLANVSALQGRTDDSGLEPSSIDRAAIVTAYSYFDKPDAMLASISAALRPGGILVIVDLPSAEEDGRTTGVEAEDVIAAAGRAGFDRVAESSVVPGHYAIKFRKR